MLKSLVSTTGMTMIILNVSISSGHSAFTWDCPELNGQYDRFKSAGNCIFDSEEDYIGFSLNHNSVLKVAEQGSTSVFPADPFLVCCWYICTRRQLLFFTCLPHCRHANGPRSLLCTSRMWMLRFDLLTKFREQCGHLTLRWAVAIHAQFSGEPVA